MVKLPKLKFFLIILTLVCLLLTSFFYQNKALSNRFVDEEQNMVLGSLLLKDEKLYGDLFVNHQPLTFIFSAGVNELTDPNSIFLLVKRHREAVIIWAFIWSVFLVYRFGLSLLLFVTVYQLSKYFLFGNLFLAEAFVIYPFIYLVSLVLFKKNIKQAEKLFVGLSLALGVFWLSPLWPALAVILLLLLIQMKNYKRTLLFLALGALPVFILVSIFSGIQEYLRDVIFINLKYFIPISIHESQPGATIKAFLAPILTFLTGTGTSPVPSLAIMRVLSATLIIFSGVLLARKFFKLPLLIFLFLGLSNLRYIELGNDYYNGFHLLPWYSVLVLTTFVSGLEVFEEVKSHLIKILTIILFLLCLWTAVFYSKDSLFITKSIDKEAYINYSRQFDFGEAIKIMKDTEDTLFVIPDEWLLYWQADIRHATSVLGYYPWMSAVPILKEEVDSMLADSPATFIYCDCNEEAILSYFGYQRISRFNQKTKLLVRQDRFNLLNDKQKNQLKFYGFNLD